MARRKLFTLAQHHSRLRAQKLIAEGVDPLQLERENESRRTERLLELERIKAVRAERDAQSEQWERDKRRLELQVRIRAVAAQRELGD